jgi:hypothetical protein
MARPALHVIFTLDCPPHGARCEPAGPKTWEASARAIDAFCTTLLLGGFPPTLFVTPETAYEHGPLFEELEGSGAEVGLLLQPPSLKGGGYKHYLGGYGREAQEAFVREALTRCGEVIGHRPRSARSAMYSASDDTFAVLAGAGFRQTSTSSPGRKTPTFHADWVGAAPDAHLASATDRLQPGSLPLLEVPVTTDATQRRGGIAPDLAIENGKVELWHAPLIEGQLARQSARDDEAPLVLCFAAGSGTAYHDPAIRPRQTLDELISHLVALDERYEVVPTTLAGAYAHLCPRPAPAPPVRSPTSDVPSPPPPAP